jgi:hypothetical protein
MLSKSSFDKLNQCHPEIKRLVVAVSERIPLNVSCGFRNEIDQNKAFYSGQSKKKWPDGEHNKLPSKAVDMEPLKRSTIDWRDKELFYYFAGYVQSVADILGIKIRWGGDWDSDKDFHDQTFNDLCHFELGEG